MAISREDIQEFLASGILESYVIGTASAEEKKQAEAFIGLSEEVAAEYDQLQVDLESIVKAHGQKAPDEVLQKALEDIRRRSDGGQVITMNWWSNWKSIAAILIAMFGLGWALMLRNEASGLRADNADLTEKIASLETEQFAIVKQKEATESINQLMINPETQKVRLFKDGNEPLQVAAFWNKEEKVAKVLPVNLPQLPENKCYQLWADVHGEMLSVGVLEAGKLQDLTYYDDAVSLNITVEPAGGNDHATVATLQTSAVIEV